MVQHKRSFILLMSGEVVSGVGMWVALLGNLQFMQHLLSSDFLKSLVLMLGILASVLFLPTAGKLIDSYDKQKILLYSTLLRCMNPILMFVAIGTDSILWMILSLVLGQIAGSTYYPTVRSALPALTDAKGLLKANTIYMNITTIARIAGTAVGGLLISILSLTWVYALTLAAYLILAAFLFYVRIPAAEGISERKSKEKLKFSEVFGVIRVQPAVLLGILTTGVVSLFLGGFNLLVLNFGEIQQSPRFMGWIYASEGASILVAGLFVKKWMDSNVNLVSASSLLVIGFALSQFGMSFADQGWLVLISFGLFGIVVAFFFPMTTTVFQRQVAPSLQGRFFSFKEMIDRVLFQIALLTTGACLDLIGIFVYLKALAVITAAVGIFAIIFGKARMLEVRPLSQEEAA